MKKNNILPIIISCIFLVIGVFFIIKLSENSEYTRDINDDIYNIPNKKKEINEYIPAIVTDEDLVKTYFTKYTMLLFEDINKAYSLLSEKSRKERFQSLAAFKVTANALTKQYTELPKIEKYEISQKKETKIFKISDKSGNKYTFNIEAVMKYTVDIE